MEASDDSIPSPVPWCHFERLQLGRHHITHLAFKCRRPRPAQKLNALVESKSVAANSAILATSFFKVSGQQPTDTMDHTSVQSVLSCLLWKCNHSMCVIARRLANLRWLAHAAGCGHFFGASTSWHTYSRCSESSTQKTGFDKLAISYPHTFLTLVCVLRPARRWVDWLGMVA